MSEVRSLEEERASYRRSVPTYQNYDAMKLVREAAAKLAEPGDLVLYRDAFRWHDHKDGMVMSNHYESQSLRYLAETFDYEIIHDFNHVGVVRRRK